MRRVPTGRGGVGPGRLRCPAPGFPGLGLAEGRAVPPLAQDAGMVMHDAPSSPAPQAWRRSRRPTPVSGRWSSAPARQSVASPPTGRRSPAGRRSRSASGTPPDAALGLRVGPRRPAAAAAGGPVAPGRTDPQLPRGRPVHPPQRAAPRLDHRPDRHGRGHRGLGGVVRPALAARQLRRRRPGADGLLPVRWLRRSGLVLGVVTGVWRRGVAMREDLDGLV